MREIAAVLDFGSQYAQLIARRIRECGVYCEILPHDVARSEVEEMSPRAIVLSGGPCSVMDENHPRMDVSLLETGIPILGICYGLQLLALELGGRLSRGDGREYGPSAIDIDGDTALFDRIGKRADVWMSHGDHVVQAPDGFDVLAHTSSCPVAAMGSREKRIYGVQFHPEVVHTPLGREILKNFLFGIAGLKGGWTMAGFIDETVNAIRSQVGPDRVICGLSGGVDSAVTAALIHRAVGEKMTAIFVDNGLLRFGEDMEIQRIFTRDFR